VAIRGNQNLSRIVEENTGAVVREEVAKTVLRGIVNPFLYPNVKLSLLLNHLLLSL
jgi:hypothetical protein